MVEKGTVGNADELTLAQKATDILNWSSNVHDGLINEDSLTALLVFIQLRGFSYGWHSNRHVTYSHWNLGHSRTGVAPANRIDIRNEIPPQVARIWEQIQPIVASEAPVLIRAYTNAYTYGNDGYIHRDSDIPNDITTIVYLNKNWDPNWPGETVLLKDGEVERAVLPKWGRVLSFPSATPHVGRGVSRICPLLRTVLVLKARREEDTE